MIKRKFKISLSIIALFSLLLVACKSGTDSTNLGRLAATSYSLNNFDNTSAPNINNVPGKDLTTAMATLQEIASLENIQPTSAAWIVGEWASYDSSGVSYKASFRNDGSYKAEVVLMQEGKSFSQIATGKWFVFKKANTSWYQLFLSDDSDPLSLENFPLEQEGADGFRIIHSYSQPIARSTLYSRLSTDIAIYPGMFFLGDYNYLAPGDFNEFRNISFSFRKNGKLRVYDKLDVINMNSEDSHTQKQYSGSWQLDAANARLIMNIEGERFRFSIQGVSTAGISLISLDTGNEVYWEKLNEGTLKSSLINIEGEYQSQNSESYFSIRPQGSGYLVDYFSDTLDFMSFFDVPATVTTDGDLQLFFPAGHFNEGKEIILRAGYNRLIMLKGFDIKDNNLQKVSSLPLAINPLSIQGTWRNALLSDAAHLSQMNYIDFYQSGKFSSTDGYGTYSFDGQNISLHKTCENKQSYKPSFSNHTLDLEIPNSAVPGLRDWGEEGSAIAEMVFKHKLDVYQLQNSPKLKPHPDIKDVYLFAQETKFRALVTYDDFISYTLSADGTGTYHAGNIGAQGIGYSGEWVSLPNFGFTYGIKYFIVQEAGKEYIVYYPSGVNLIYGDSQITYIDEIKNKNKDNVRIVELYHRRTAICESDENSLISIPLDK